MSEHAHHHGDGPGHETTDVAARPILLFVIGLVVFGAVIEALMATLMTGFVARDTKAAVRDPALDITLRDHGDLKVVAPLQRDTTGDMLRMYDAENQILTTATVNPKTKAVRIPIDRAIDIVAKNSATLLKARNTQATPPKGLSYSEKAKAYMATP